MIVEIYKEAINDVSNNSNQIFKDYQTTKNFLLLFFTGYFVLKIIK